LADQHKFVDDDTTKIIELLTALYEGIMGVAVLPASPENLFLRVAANIVQYVHNGINYAGNQNLPRFASDANLDALGELFFLRERPGAKAAVCTVRFYISEPQTSAVLIPSGTRVTDVSGGLEWATSEDIYVPIGDVYVDAPVVCLTLGALGNGYAPGQIRSLIDVFPYYAYCENITESGAGANVATDAEYYGLMTESEDAYSTAGPRDGYVYRAKSVSTEIADAVANTPVKGSGRVNLYALMRDGTTANDETKNAILAACNEDTARPLTDFVQVQEPEIVNYDIEFTYYISRGTGKSAAEIERDVAAAVDEYVAWQYGRLGRDINPDELRQRVKAAGVKRIELVSPIFTELRDGVIFDDTDEETSAIESVPQLAELGDAPTIINGGYEYD
jgi:phage-related baseplate assembly protein